MSDSEDKITPWQTLPIYRSLTEQILILGVPKPILVLNFLVAFLFCFNLHFYYIIPISIVVHCGAIYLAKNDDQFFDCMKLYQGKRNYYST